MVKSIPFKENWYILGTGAIGCYWAVQLAEAGYPITLLTHHQSPRLTDITINLNARQRKVTCQSTAASTATRPTRPAALLVATKTYATLDALKAIEATLRYYKVIILMQNGMGVVEQIRTVYPGLPLVIGITNQGAYRVEPFHIVQAGTGHTWLGCLPDELQQSSPESVAELTAIAPDHIHWDNDILMRAWVKLGINCVINGLTVTENVLNGELLEPGYRHRIELLCNEIAQVISGKCHRYSGDDLLREVLQVAESTRSNISSMRQDVLHKQRTEIDFLNGFLCATAASMQIQLPENDRLLTEIYQVLAKA